MMEDPMVEIAMGSREARLRRAHISRALALAFLVCLCIGAVAGPALAQSYDTELSTDDQVILNGPAVIEGTVRDTVVVFNGDTEIVGTVGRDVVSCHGDVVVRSGAAES